MKNVAVALAVSFAMLSAGFAFLLYRGGSPDDTEARADRQEIRGKLEDLAAAIARLEERIEALERRGEEIAAAHGIDRPAGPAEPAAKGEAEGGGSEGPAARDAPAPTVVTAREALAAGDPKKTDSLREFVSQVIRQERDERQRRQAAEAQAQMREWKSLHEGPYGKYNYRINSLAKKLGLTDQQKEYYHNVLQENVPRLRELRKDVKWNEVEARENYLRSLSQLQQHFENMVKQGLTNEQRQQYEGLPSVERNLEVGEGIISFSGGPDGADVFTVPVPPPGMEGEGHTMEVEGLFEGGPGLPPPGGAAVKILIRGPGSSPEASPEDSLESSKPAEPSKPADGPQAP